MHARALLLFLLIPCAWPQPNSEGELMERAKQRMATNLATLPRYTCQESIDRSETRTAKQKLLSRDRVNLEVGFIEDKEMFSWPGSGSFQPYLLDQLPQMAVTGAGGFGGWTRALFGPSAPRFTYAGDCTAGGRPGRRYNFRVPVESSTYRIRSESGQAVAPYSGSVCVDPASSDIMLLEIRAERTEAPVAAISESIQYGWTHIGSADFLLPRDFELIATDREGGQKRSLTHFSACRAFTTESSISFSSDPAALPAPQTKPAELQLPEGISMDLSLETPITFEESAVGDPITARLSHALKIPGAVVPKGSIVSGRIRGLEQYFEPEKYFAVTLEFYSLIFDDRRAVFRAQLTGPRLQDARRVDAGGKGVDTLSTLDSQPAGLDIGDSPPGSGTFRIRERRLHLSRGLRMTWETQK